MVYTKYTSGTRRGCYAMNKQPICEITVQMQVGGKRSPRCTVRLAVYGWGQFEPVRTPVDELPAGARKQPEAYWQEVQQWINKRFSTSVDWRHSLARKLGEVGQAAVPVLMQALKDGSAYVRGAAAHALGDLGDSRAVPELIALLERGEKDDLTRAFCVQALCTLGDARAVPVLVRTLMEGNVHDFALVDILEALGTMRDPQAVPALLAWLPHPRLGVKAARALAEIGDPSALPFLSLFQYDPDIMDLLKEKGVQPMPIDEAVRHVAQMGRWDLITIALPQGDELVAAVAKLGSEAIPALLKALEHRDTIICQSAAKALGRIGDTQFAPHLSLFQHFEAYREALSLMGVQPIPIPDAVRQVAQRGDWGVLLRAAIYAEDAEMTSAEEDELPLEPQLQPDAHPMLRFVDTEEYLDEYDEVFDFLDEEEDIQPLEDSIIFHEDVMNAIVALGAEAVPALIEKLNDENIALRFSATAALGLIKDAHAVPSLIAMLESPSDEWNLTQMVAYALGQIGDAQAVPALTKTLSTHPVEWVRAASADALGQIGDPRAVPALIDAIADIEEDVADAAGHALVEIGGNAVLSALVQTIKFIPEIRARAAATLVLMGEQALPALEELVNDKDRAVRLMAVSALVEIGGARAMRVLQKRLPAERDSRVARAIRSAIDLVKRSGRR